MRLVRERDDDALHVVAIDDRADLVGGPEHGDLGEIAAHRLRIVVDEADEAQPELRMLGDLPPEELADVPAPTMSVFCRNRGRLRATERATALALSTQEIATVQRTTRKVSGCACR